MNREEFMTFFRAEDFQDYVTEADCKEIFLNILKGSSDLSLELLEALYENYGLKFIKER